jgi:hypothetical protein
VGVWKAWKEKDLSRGTDFDFGEGVFFFLLNVCSDIHGVCGYGLWWDVTIVRVLGLN